MQNITNPDIKPIDIDSLIKNQKNKFIKNLPQFLINLIKRIIKQDGLNKLIIDNHDKNGIEFNNACMKDLNISYNIVNKENIPDKGHFIFVSNHPLGAADVGVIIEMLSKKYKNIKTVGNKLLGNVENLKDILIEVGVFTKTDVKSIKKMNDIYADKDVQIYILPSGMVSRKDKGVIKDLPWKHSFIRNAVKFQRDIIPIFVDDRNTNKFYFIARLRKFFKIKLSIESLFIAGELFKKRNKTIPLIVGKVISYKIFDKSKSVRDWALTVQDIVYDLKKKN